MMSAIVIQTVPVDITAVTMYAPAVWTGNSVIVIQIVSADIVLYIPAVLHRPLSERGVMIT